MKQFNNLDRRLGTVEFAEVGIAQTEDNKTRRDNTTVIGVADGHPVLSWLS